MINKMELIIGASGYIGRNISNYFSKKGKLNVGTYYNTPKEGLEYFDLKNPELNSLNIDFSNIKHAIICSAIPKIKECEENKKETYEVNVTGTKKLIKELFERDIVPIFLSSDRVFDGKKGNYTELDKTDPHYNYGRHKKAIEDFLLESKQKSLIIRLSRVFGLDKNDGTLLTTLLNQLEEGKAIRCAEDQRFSLTYINDLTKILYEVVDKDLKGIYNMASINSFSRLELAILLKKDLKIDSGKIISCSIRDFGFSDPLPSDLSMSNEKIKGDIDIQFSSIKEYINELK